MDEVETKHLVRLDLFIDTYAGRAHWGALDEYEQDSLERGLKDADAGRLKDAHEVIAKFD